MRAKFSAFNVVSAVVSMFLYGAVLWCIWECIHTLVVPVHPIRYASSFPIFEPVLVIGVGAILFLFLSSGSLVARGIVRTFSEYVLRAKRWIPAIHIFIFLVGLGLLITAWAVGSYAPAFKDANVGGASVSAGATAVHVSIARYVFYLTVSNVWQPAAGLVMLLAVLAFLVRASRSARVQIEHANSTPGQQNVIDP